MFRSLRFLSLLLLILNASQFIKAETLTFDDLVSADGALYTVGTYNSYAFYDFDFANPMYYPNSIPNDSTPYILSSYYPFEPPPYPYYSVLDQNGNPLDPSVTPSFYSISGQSFTLNNMLIATDIPVSILGYRNGVLVDHASTLDANGQTDLLTLNWSGIDAVLFPNTLGYVGVNIDTINLNEPVTTANATPEPSTIILLGSGLFGLVTVARRSLQTQRRAIETGANRR